ncbi:MAG TPA: hypothetical protein VG388_09750 [Solirubrobacteraceae bacterium]|jgi:hypothetical protein|nr:hypothetical protein [Solirubrobacteraceae bacterium]
MLVALLARLLAGLTNVIANPPRPRIIRAGLGRAGLLMVVLLVLGLAPIHLRRGWTAAVGTAVFAVILLAAVSAAAGFRALVERMREANELRLFGGRVTVPLPSLDRELHVFEASMGVLREFGLALPALVFFCAWAFIYALIWAYSPTPCSLDLTRVCHGAFQGAGTQPTFGDFLYVAVNLAFANPPPDLIAHSRLAHMTATLEVISGVALVTLYASAFFGLGRSRDASPLARPSVADGTGSEGAAGGRAQ